MDFVARNSSPKAANGSDRSAEEGEEEGDDGKLAPTSPLEGNNTHQATATPTSKSVEPSRPPAQHVIGGFECVEGALMDASWCSETMEDGHRRENSDLHDGVRCDSRIAQVSSPYPREDDERLSGGGLAGRMGEDKVSCSNLKALEHLGPASMGTGVNRHLILVDENERNGLRFVRPNTFLTMHSVSLVGSFQDGPLLILFHEESTIPLW